MTFGDNLTRLIKECGYTQTSFADAVGVSAVTIRNWEQNIKKPSMDAMIRICRLLNISFEEITDTNTGSILITHDEKKLVETFRKLDSRGKETVIELCRQQLTFTENRHSYFAHADESKMIPLYEEPAAAGISSPNDSDDYEMIIPEYNGNTIPDFAVRISGDSMVPYIHSGEIVYVKRTSEIRNGEIGIFCVDGATYCKHFYKDTSGSIWLVSSNEDLQYSNVFISSESNTSFVCYGKVLLNVRAKMPEYFTAL